MRTSFLIFFLLYSVGLFCQNNFEAIDQKAKDTPRSKSSSVSTLVNYLTENLASDVEKARAIYAWLAYHIDYDFNSLTQPMSNEDRLARQAPEKVLKSRKGICQGYSQLFEVMAKEAGLQACWVGGDSKERNDRVSRIRHAWNLVKIDGKWQLIDVTWGAGYLDENNRYQQKFRDKFFMMAPEKFILRHYPHDPLFQLLPTPVDRTVFESSSSDIEAFLAANKDGDWLNRNAEIDAYAALETIDERNCVSGERIVAWNPTDNNGIFKKGYCQYKKTQLFYEEWSQTLSETMASGKRPDKATLTNWLTVIADLKAENQIAQEWFEKVTGNDQEGQGARKLLGSVRGFDRFLSKQKQQFKKIMSR